MMTKPYFVLKKLCIVVNREKSTWSYTILVLVIRPVVKFNVCKIDVKSAWLHRKTADVENFGHRQSTKGREQLKFAYRKFFLHENTYYCLEWYFGVGRATRDANLFGTDEHSEIVNFSFLCRLKNGRIHWTPLDSLYDVFETIVAASCRE